MGVDSQELKAAKEFSDKASTYKDKLGDDFATTVQQTHTLCEQTKALECESLICFALKCKSHGHKVAIIRNQLGDLTGKRIREALVHPVLCQVARDICN